MASGIEADKVDIKKLFSEFWYEIPLYQRQYVWDTDNINKLLEDLIYSITKKPNNEFFLGSLVLQKLPEPEFKEYTVLDGQQRLITLLLMMAVIRDITNNEKLERRSQKRICQEKDEFEGIPQRIRIVYRIRPKVEKFIEEFVVTKNGTSKEDELKKLTEDENISISHMAKAIIEITRFFKETFKETNELSKFAIFLGAKCVFVYIAAEKEADAFKLFEILNSRGTPLTNADILKGINIEAIVGETNQKNYATQWEVIETDFGENFDRFLSFMRTILVKERARANLLEEFKDNIYDNGKQKLCKGTQTIDYIQNYSDIYDKILYLSDSSLHSKYKNLITFMTEGLPSKDWIPPLLYFYDRFKGNGLLPFLKKLEYKFVADWVLRQTPTIRIENMNNILKAIEREDSSTTILSNNELFSVDNVAFRDILNQRVYGTGYAKYILLKYEYLMSENEVQLSGFKTISIEHVLPQTPSPEWKKDFSDDEIGYWTHRLANLVLINGRKQPKLSNLPFTEKRDRYLKDKVDVFKGSYVFIGKEDYWTPARLEIRQKEMLDELTQQNY